jgi:hypothetical protein
VPEAVLVPDDEMRDEPIRAHQQFWIPDVAGRSKTKELQMQ